jgi:hypothetical protein
MLCVLDTALDVARALGHMHARGALHGALSSAAVLLKVSGGGPRCVCAGGIWCCMLLVQVLLC